MIGRRVGLLLALGSMLVLGVGCSGPAGGTKDAGTGGGQVTDGGPDGGPDAGPVADTDGGPYVDTDAGPNAGIPPCPAGDGGCQMATGQAGCPGRTFSGFAHRYKCEPATSLWNGAPPDGGMAACLTACEHAPNTVYCWYLDGTGGFPEDCRVCAPVAGVSLFNGGFGNDWGGTFNYPGCP